jgi:hypothetical protein
MRTRNKVLASVLAVAALGSVVALGVFGLFSATTQNAGNEISSGTVALSDNDAGSAQFNITAAKPGDTWTRCIKVTYNGSLPADVRIYTVGGAGPLAPYLHLKLSQGTQAESTFPSCTGFVPDATNGSGTLFEGAAFGSIGNSWETGAPVMPFGQTVWNPSDSLVFKSILSLNSDAPDLAQGNTSGVFTIYAEARNDS